MLTEVREFRIGPIDDEEGEFAPLSAMNALRHPGAWQELQAAAVQGSLRGTHRSLLSEVARQAGMELEVPESRYWKEEMWMSKSGWIRSRRGQVPVLEALEELLPGEPYAFVVEPGRIRVLHTQEALEFWSRWAAKENLKE